VSAAGRLIDPGKLPALLNAEAPRLRRYVSRRIPCHLRSVLSPDDVLQNVWLAAFRELPNFRAVGRDAFQRWIMLITKRKLINAIRAANTLKRGGAHTIQGDAAAKASSFANLFERVPSRGRTPSSEAAVSQATTAVQIALAGLPEDRRQVVELRYMKGKGHDEIATIMGKTTRAVNSLLFRARQQMKESMGPAAAFLSDADSSELNIVGVRGDPT
jgi:RNA polymerase sigma factor (sigma-70 family)